MPNWSKNTFWWNDGSIEIRSKSCPGHDFIKGKIPKSYEDIVRRFWNYVDIPSIDECWEWKGACATRHMPYGRFFFENKRQEAHRVVWKITYGDPGNLCVLHKCDNPKCVNPSHLFLGTKSDNNRDRTEKGRTKTTRGAKHKLSKLTDDQIIEIRKMIERGTSEIAKEYGISRSLVWKIRTRKVWTHVV